MTAVSAVLYKSWLETRLRFLTGIVATVAVAAFMTLLRPHIVAQWRRDLVEHPEWQNPVWFHRVLEDYSFYLYHYLYQDMLQKAVIVFAVLLGVGGLLREGAHGTAGFTLSLPVTRRTLLLTRLAVTAGELAALGLVALVTIVVCSRAVGESYDALHAALHVSLIVLGSLFGLAASLAISSVVEGEHAPTLIGLSAVTMLFFVAQPYTDGERQSAFIAAINLPAVLAGGPAGTAAAVPWIGLGVVLAITMAVVAFTIRRSAVRDY